MSPVGRCRRATLVPMRPWRRSRCPAPRPPWSSRRCSRTWARSSGPARRGPRSTPTARSCSAYRVRNGPDTIDETVVARSVDGERYDDRVRARAGPLRRAVDRAPGARAFDDGGWRMYVSLATPELSTGRSASSNAADPRRARDAPTSRTAFAGDARHRGQGPDRAPARRASGTPGSAATCSTSPAQEDRMNTAYATSADGLDLGLARHRARGPARASGTRAARGSRTILPDGRAAYDGRASAAENWFERTGLARPPTAAATSPPATPVADVRYLEALPLPGGGYRIFYEARLAGRDATSCAPSCARPDRLDGGRGPSRPAAAVRGGAARRAGDEVRRAGRRAAARERRDAVTDAVARGAGDASPSASGSGASARRHMRPAIEAACDDVPARR